MASQLKKNGVDIYPITSVSIDVADSVASQEIEPNMDYIFATRSSDLAISFATPITGIPNIYHFFITIDGTTLPTITGLTGGDIVWKGGDPVFALSKTYEVCVQNNLGYWSEF